MTDSPTSRVPAGVPTGGQFAATQHAEASVALTDAAPSCAAVEVLAASGLPGTVRPADDGSAAYYTDPDGHEYLVRVGEDRSSYGVSAVDLDASAFAAAFHPAQDRHITDMLRSVEQQAADMRAFNRVAEAYVPSSEPRSRCISCGWGADDTTWDDELEDCGRGDEDDTCPRCETADARASVVSTSETVSRDAYYGTVAIDNGHDMPVVLTGFTSRDDRLGGSKSTMLATLDETHEYTFAVGADNSLQIYRGEDFGDPLPVWERAGVIGEIERRSASPVGSPALDAVGLLVEARSRALTAQARA